MITSYMVTCPHPDCRWFGSLLPRDNLDSWSGSKPSRAIIVFQCPACGREWQARVVGDDVVRLLTGEALPNTTQQANGT